MFSDLPTGDLGEAMIEPQHDSGHAFIRLTDHDEPRVPWVFQIGGDGRAGRILRHSVYLDRIE